MRKLAPVLLLVTGCTPPTTWQPDEVPSRSPEAERVSDEEVSGGEEVGGGGPSCGDPVSTSADGASVGVGPDGDASGDGDVAASWMPTLGDACLGVCLGLSGGGCIEMTYVCGAAEVITVGSVTVPCMVALAVACSSVLATPLACPALCPR